jgi:hypothetical protein
MARIVKVAERHVCQNEIARDIQVGTGEHRLWYGTIVECSCKKRFELQDFADGDTWVG